MCQNLDLRFLPFYCFFVKNFPAPFRFLDLAFYCLFSVFDLVSYHTLFSPFFFVLVLSLFFLAHMASSLAYPNLLGNESLVVVVVIIN
jgi:hypothetical protein